jgi:sugar phosphate isomerase/epimerase
MSNLFQRREFLTAMLGISAAATAASCPATGPAMPLKRIVSPRGLKTSLNAYSFNGPLTDGSMSISDMLDFCADNGFDGVDITAYYFSGYPKVPADAYLYGIKRKAARLGLAISGTGVRNDFTLADKTKRGQEVDLVKRWIEVASKIGAPVIRIFAGNQENKGISREAVTEWMLKDIGECVEYGKNHGVIIGLQNHDDFVKTADQVIGIIRAINSEWLGLILDTGSYRQHDPYEEIRKSIPYTVNWQIKEKVFINGAEVDTDMERLAGIIKGSGYRGYLPIETLGPGDAKQKIRTLFENLQRALAEG